MFFRASRARRGHDALLPHKMFMVMIGGALGLAGMAFEQRWLVWAGIAVLAVVLVISLVQRRQEGGRADRQGSSEGDGEI
jgi:membrane protein implicated in regulation of membrane protease activity